MNRIVYIFLSVILAGGLVYFGYWLGLTEKESVLLEGFSETKGNKMSAGEVGEILVGEEGTGLKVPLITSNMPPTIFSTTGSVFEIILGEAIIRGSGTNFADRLPRNLTAVFTTDTVTFSKNQSFRWHGLAGLKQLEPGMKVLIEGEGNIRGKTEFEVKTVNIL